MIRKPILTMQYNFQFTGRQTDFYNDNTSILRNLEL